METMQGQGPVHARIERNRRCMCNGQVFGLDSAWIRCSRGSGACVLLSPCLARVPQKERKGDAEPFSWVSVLHREASKQS